MSCVVIYQIHNIAGYGNSIYSPFVDAAIKSKGHVEYHKIHKRQVNSDQYRRCYGTILPQFCTNGLGQEFADLALQCGESSTVQDLFSLCQRNPMGVYCGGIATGRELYDISAACTENNCTSQCRNLLINTRNEFGCCINVLYNDTYTPFAFRYSLWASCEVEPVPNDCTSSTLIQRPISIDPSCTSSSYGVRLGSLHCSTRYIEPILETLANENNCGNYSQSISEQCGVNEAGVPCYAVNASSIYGNAHSVCATTTTATTSCSEDCRAGLQDLKSSAGCCINYIFNDSDVNIPILAYEFWRRCGVATPGMCEIQFNSATINTALNNLALILLPILMAAYF